jgi:hypothetical protein
MSRYFSIFRNFSSITNPTFFPAVKNEVFVGRWSIPNKNTDIVKNQICDRNNEDHCGVCINNDSNLMKKNIVEDRDDDDYLRPYFM